MKKLLSIIITLCLCLTLIPSNLFKTLFVNAQDEGLSCTFDADCGEGFSCNSDGFCQVDPTAILRYDITTSPTPLPCGGQICAYGCNTLTNICNPPPSPSPFCGNGNIEGTEQCDGWNTGTCLYGCTAGCKCATPVPSPSPFCGNGVLEGTEQCDGWQLGSCTYGCTTGCKCATPIPSPSATPTPSPSPSPSPSPFCGNGMLDPGEYCDDGNMVDGDGCNATCGQCDYCAACDCYTCVEPDSSPSSLLSRNSLPFGTAEFTAALREINEINSINKDTDGELTRNLKTRNSKGKQKSLPPSKGKYKKVRTYVVGKNGIAEVELNSFIKFKTVTYCGNCTGVTNMTTCAGGTCNAASQGGACAKCVPYTFPGSPGITTCRCAPNIGGAAPGGGVIECASAGSSPSANNTCTNGNSCDASCMCMCGGDPPCPDSTEGSCMLTCSGVNCRIVGDANGNKCFPGAVPVGFDGLDCKTIAGTTCNPTTCTCQAEKCETGTAPACGGSCSHVANSRCKDVAGACTCKTCECMTGDVSCLVDQYRTCDGCFWNPAANCPAGSKCVNGSTNPNMCDTVACGQPGNNMAGSCVNNGCNAANNETCVSNAGGCMCCNCNANGQKRCKGNGTQTCDGCLWGAVTQCGAKKTCMNGVCVPNATPTPTPACGGPAVAGTCGGTCTDPNQQCRNVAGTCSCQNIGCVENPVGSKTCPASAACPVISGAQTKCKVLYDAVGNFTGCGCR